MIVRQQLLAMMATAALLALPILAVAQSTPDPAPLATGSGARTVPGGSTQNLAADPRTLREGRRASRLIGASVYNDFAETVGEVDEVLIPRDGGAPVAIISVGGFLGIGAKLVAVPFDSLRMGSSRWTMPGVTKESLNALPGFSYDNMGSSRG